MKFEERINDVAKKRKLVLFFKAPKGLENDDEDLIAFIKSMKKIVSLKREEDMK